VSKAFLKFHAKYLVFVDLPTSNLVVAIDILNSFFEMVLDCELIVEKDRHRVSFKLINEPTKKIRWAISHQLHFQGFPLI